MKHVDVAILLTYLIGVVALGCGFWRRGNDPDRFMTAGRSLPGWAVGLSIFGSYISSISFFLANPGKAYAENWNAAVFAFAMPLAAWISVRWFVPFYRRAGHVSAYEHLERRFGPWARTYAVVCFILFQLARLGMILYLLSLALAPLLGWEGEWIILVIGLALTLYPLLGGTEAWIWAGVIQSAILLLGAAICIVVLLLGLPAGPAAFSEANAAGKFSLGDFDLGLAASTFWVVLAYGLVTHLQNFGIDQSYVQRYITAESDRAAGKSVWIGTLLFMPVSLAFFFIGTALWAFYRSRDGVHETLAPDAVFPHFIATELPPGLTGLVIAAICAAAMDSNLNCCSTLFLCDVYRRYFRPDADDRESVWVLRLSTLALGAVGTVVALALLHSRKGALDVWWQLAGIFSGGLLGLFLLGILSQNVRSAHAAVGVVAGVAVILWMTFSETWTFLRSPFHSLLPIVFGTLAILIVGYIASRLPWIRPRMNNN